MADAFLQRLRERRTVDVDAPGVVEGIRSHFQMLPSRYAMDINLDGLDVLNHLNLLKSARADPSAVSFQVRSVSIQPYSGLDRRPSFGGLDTLITEVCGK